MKALTKILTGGVGLVALVGAAAPAAAQYPGYGYGYGGGDVLGQIISQVLRGGTYGSYGSYGYNPQRERYMVEQCARATEIRLQRNYGYAGSRYGGGYGSPYGGYNQGYGGYNQARIVNITRVDRRNNGGVKIWGTATSGQGYGQGYDGYGQGYGGYGGYGGYNTYNAAADLRFDCTIDYRGRITNIDINRNRYGVGYRGY
jgi:hypothetical protein